ncbi:Late embryogenesis abundant hydroxyproline-rich glycoprotein family protein [Quillaja saponaria]|uniref:Late embryogenesis abundant hydroxyproline-rich glycoprotein family protein n=1 Tax=Quillaja saponaria TaxID=32244 RepID=A0AAD7LU55_QUISA|nr:Late embryogenesis abundant hydroxyproline-rich glycoprotein family protein [Quillaja saponaria]
MAELGSKTQTSAPSLIRNPSTRCQSKPARHVAFDVPSNVRSGLGDYEYGGKEERHHRPFCFVCATWGCILVSILILIVLIGGVSYFSFFQSSMPEVHVMKLSVSKLDVTNSKGQTQMDTYVTLRLDMKNMNEKLKLSYSGMNVEVSTSQKIMLGKSKIDNFVQKPQNTTELDIRLSVRKSEVDVDAVADLKTDLKNMQTVFDVVVNGNLCFFSDQFKLNTVPFLISCLEISKKMLIMEENLNVMLRSSPDER